MEETSSLWSALSCEAVFSKLKSSPLGLTHAEASKRLAEFGLNELQAARRISPWRILLEQLNNILCQEDAYLKELVRYIHLSPIRAKMVEGPTGLKEYAYNS